MKKYQELEQKIEELQQEVERLKKEEQENQLPEMFNIEPIMEVLKNPRKNYGRLLASFSWSDTPQGLPYWENIANGNKPFSDKDIIQIQKWVILYYQQN
jgi:TolA-binding protein